MFRGRMKKREAMMFRGELVGMVNTVVARVAKCGFIGGAKH